jgi:hypothetical protein
MAGGLTSTSGCAADGWGVVRRMNGPQFGNWANALLLKLNGYDSGAVTETECADAAQFAEKVRKLSAENIDPQGKLSRAFCCRGLDDLLIPTSNGWIADDRPFDGTFIAWAHPVSSRNQTGANHVASRATYARFSSDLQRLASPISRRYAAAMLGNSLEVIANMPTAPVSASLYGATRHRDMMADAKAGLFRSCWWKASTGCRAIRRPRRAVQTAVIPWRGNPHRERGQGRSRFHR